MRHISPLISRPAEMGASPSSPSSSPPSEGPTQTPYADSAIFMLSLPDDDHSSSPASSSAAAAAPAVSTTSPVAVPRESLGEFLTEEKPDGDRSTPVATDAQALGLRVIPDKMESSAVKSGPAGWRRKSFAVKKTGVSKRFRRGARIMRSSSSSESDPSPDGGGARKAPEQTAGAQPRTSSPGTGEPGPEVGGRDLRDDARGHHHCRPAEAAPPSVGVCLKKARASIGRDELHEGGVRTEEMEFHEAQKQFPATAEGVIDSGPQKLTARVGDLLGEGGMPISAEDSEDQAESESKNPAIDINNAAANDAEGAVYSGPRKSAACIPDPHSEGGMPINVEDHVEAENQSPASNIASAASEIAIDLRQQKLPSSLKNPVAGEKSALPSSPKNPVAGEKSEDNSFPGYLLQIVSALKDGHQPDKLNALIKMLNPDGCSTSKNLDNVDVLDILEMKGIKIPQPRWYRPGGYDA